MASKYNIILNILLQSHPKIYQHDIVSYKAIMCQTIKTDRYRYSLIVRMLLRCIMPEIFESKAPVNSILKVC
jgi:hypothetical protein